MTAERYLCLEIACGVEEREVVTAALWQLDSLGFEELDNTDSPRLLAYFGPSANAESLVEQLGSIVAASGVNIAIAAHDIRYDGAYWIEKYSRTFTSFEVNPTYWIYPPWGASSEDHPVNILLEPGHGFGTGTHESTQLALVAMEDVAPLCQSAIDVGTGSGILSVAAAKLNSRLQIVAFDTDPLATASARKTFRDNGLEQIPVYTGGIDSLTGRFDLVLANLTEVILSRLSEDLHLRTGRYLIASGFTLAEADRVKQDLERGNVLRCSEQWTKSEWACWLLKRCEES